eukprot:7505584-Pyramimonas_sp.AAC.1
MGRSHIWAAGRLSRRGRGHTLASAPYIPQLALELGGRETKREPVAPIQQAQRLIYTRTEKGAGQKDGGPARKLPCLCSFVLEELLRRRQNWMSGRPDMEHDSSSHA